jgi:hypothetical protein
VDAVGAGGVVVVGGGGVVAVGREPLISCLMASIFSSILSIFSSSLSIRVLSWSKVQMSPNESKSLVVASSVGIQARMALGIQGGSKIARGCLPCKQPALKWPRGLFRGVPPAGHRRVGHGGP